MKFKSVLFLFIIFSKSVYADNTPYGQPILYCPQLIECTRADDLTSCSLSDNESDMWRNAPLNGGQIAEGTYTLKKVESVYQSTKIRPIPTCTYSYTDVQNVEKLLSITIKTKENTNDEWDYYPISITAYLGKTSMWNIYGENASCISENPLWCPLVQAPEIAYLNNPRPSILFGLFYSDNHLDGKKMFTYQELINRCGPSSSCKLKVGLVDWFEYNLYTRTGTMILNLQSPDIITVVSLKTSSISPCTLKQKGALNLIYCEPTKVPGR